MWIKLKKKMNWLLQVVLFQCLSLLDLLCFLGGLITLQIIQLARTCFEVLLTSLEHDCLWKHHRTTDIFCSYARKHDTVHMTTWVDFLSNLHPPSAIPVLDPYSSLHPSHSLFLTSLVDLWPTTMLD